jgi:hypothetical protein
MTIINGYEYQGAAPREGKKRMSARVNLTGRRFGRLIAVECLGVMLDGYRLWGCVCDCGSKKAVRSRELLEGDTKSCGCLQTESRAIHGGTNKLPYGHASRNELLASYQKSARGRGIDWQLTDKEFFEIVSEPCSYCGTPPDSIRKPNKSVNGEFMYSGIDRVDNSRGYVSGNVVPCCWYCNRAKGVLSLQEFLGWCNRLSQSTAARQARFEKGKQPEGE